MRRFCRRGRPVKCRKVNWRPLFNFFTPSSPNGKISGSVTLFSDELEALRLVYYEELSQEEAGDRMGVSQATIWRLVNSGRKKIVKSLIEGKSILILSRGEKAMDIEEKSF